MTASSVSVEADVIKISSLILRKGVVGSGDVAIPFEESNGLSLNWRLHL